MVIVLWSRVQPREYTALARIDPAFEPSTNDDDFGCTLGRMPVYCIISVFIERTVMDIHPIDIDMEPGVGQRSSSDGTCTVVFTDRTCALRKGLRAATTLLF